MFNVLLVAFRIVAVCLVIHVTSIVWLGESLLDWREKRHRQLHTFGYMILLLIVFSVTILLHMLETAIWALFYYERSLFPNFETSLYFSITCYTTIGFGDVTLPPAWRMLGGIEGVSGVLLCGLSTAFVFAVVNSLFQMRIQREIEIEEAEK
jgi:voltage-gated potassium channel